MLQLHAIWVHFAALCTIPDLRNDTMPTFSVRSYKELAFHRLKC